MIEKHILGNFLPKGAKYLVLGSFFAKGLHSTLGYDWYYGSRFNQFWRIIEEVYDVTLKDKASKIQLFTELKMGIADIIYSCERENGNSSYSNLTNITYNYSIIELLNTKEIDVIYFTSVFVEKNFRKLFLPKIKDPSHIKLTTLPSPSPRYARLRIDEKVVIYSQLLPPQK